MDEKQVQGLQDIIPWEEIRAYVDAHTRVKIPDEELRNALQRFRSLNQYQIASMLRDQDRFCTRCGECCRKCTPIEATKQEMKRIAEYLGVPYKKFKKKHHFKHKETGVYDLRGKPCPFLQDPNTCTIYPVRPLTCRLYPLGKWSAEASLTGEMRLPDDCPAVKKMLLLQLLTFIVHLKLVQEEIIPENPPLEYVEPFLNRFGFSLSRNPIEQVLVSKTIQTTRRPLRYSP